MPELPDVTVYIEALEARIVDREIQKVRIVGPSLLKSVDPPIGDAEGRRVVGLRRLGKRIVWELEGKLFLVFHLMIAGRFRWKKAGAAVSRKLGLAGFDFENGTLLLTEAGTKRRASLHFVRGEEELATHDRGGLEVMDAHPEAFRERLLQGNHTLKRALTDPTLFSGIGNAYSDEILHRARLSPVRLTRQLEESEITRLFEATRETLALWTERLRAQAGDDFPEKVTAFRPEMAVHGRYRESCPDCGAPVQRIVYAQNETNYCAPCQTGGKLLADRALSRLLKKDWPRSLEELEARRSA
ncbi:MAG: DNA-formamidopyrimidine glycosylase family protein [Myxococcota bacterium]|nr:DNA-formamidopyrimidine glycosylase family protein [Myxococcota bacterium]